MALDPDVALRGFDVAWTILAGAAGAMFGLASDPATAAPMVMETAPPN